MNFLSTRRLRAVATLLVAGPAIWACDNAGPVAPATSSPTSTASAVVPLVHGQLNICKFGTSATFTVAIAGGATTTHTVTDGNCALVDNAPTTFPLKTATITEVPQPGVIALDSIKQDSLVGAVIFSRKITGANSVTVRYGLEVGQTLSFFNRLVVQNPSLTITKTGSGTVNAGSPMSFTITVNSGGPGTANGVTLNDPLPGGSGVNWSITTQPAGNPCTITGSAPNQTLSCNFGNLASGASRAVTIGSATSFASCGSYANTASASATNHATVTASATNTVRCPGLTIAKTGSGTVDAGNPISFTITVNSGGPGTATGVTLNDPLPGGSGVNWSITTQPAGNPCTITGSAPSQTLSCNFGDLAAGVSRAVTVSSATTTASCGVFNNTASASATNHATVTASATDTVRCPPPPVFEGCTPGFWKQDQHFQFWTAPFTTSTLIKNVFAVGSLTTRDGIVIGDQTLLAGLSLPGGPTVGDAVAILMRAAIAGILNAASPNVNYPLTAAQIVSQVNAAIATGDRDTILSLAGTLDTNNNAGCTAKD
jgi:uncharacterized repeat protein (TIGR01451 family)